MSYLYRSDDLRCGRCGKTSLVTMVIISMKVRCLISNLFMYIIVIDRFFSILASSCGTTMADFISPYGENALNTSAKKNWKMYRHWSTVNVPKDILCKMIFLNLTNKNWPWCSLTFLVEWPVSEKCIIKEVTRKVEGPWENKYKFGP